MSADATPSELTQLFPCSGNAAVEARAAYGALEFVELAPPNRPYVIVNMVATADGQGRVGENTAELGDATDAALFATLRERVDCVMAGVSTIEIEQYNAPARSEAVRERRLAAGLSPRPLVATVTRSGRLPLTAPLFADPDLRVLVFSGTEFDASGAAAEVIRVPATEPEPVLHALRADFGVRSVLLEGGPRLNHGFFAAGVVDELFLTLAPVLTGSSDSFPIIAGALPAPRPLELVSTYTGNEHLFLRYRVG